MRVRFFYSWSKTTDHLEFGIGTKSSSMGILHSSISERSLVVKNEMRMLVLGLGSYNDDEVEYELVLHCLSCLKESQFTHWLRVQSNHVSYDSTQNILSQQTIALHHSRRVREIRITVSRMGSSNLWISKARGNIADTKTVRR